MKKQTQDPGQFHTLDKKNQNIRITTIDGASAEIYLHGAQVTSWIPSKKKEHLFLSEKSFFGADSSIRGGIPVIFPQFSDVGPLPKHGFARKVEWEEGSISQSGGATTIEFLLSDTPQTRNLWPYHFIASLNVSITSISLQVTLKITNTDNALISFTSALHTYLAISDIQKIKIKGLQNKYYLENTQPSHPPLTQTNSDLVFTGEVDRTYPGAGSRLQLWDGSSITEIESRGFSDTVIWNPWEEKCRMLKDMKPDGYRHMVCIEAGAIHTPVVLTPDQIWQGTQILTSMD